MTRLLSFVETTSWCGRPAGAEFHYPKFFAAGKQASRYVGKLNLVWYFKFGFRPSCDILGVCLARGFLGVVVSAQGEVYMGLAASCVYFWVSLLVLFFVRVKYFVLLRAGSVMYIRL